jgi:hypothetical protein
MVGEAKNKTRQLGKNRGILKNPVGLSSRPKLVKNKKCFALVISLVKLQLQLTTLVLKDVM